MNTQPKTLEINQDVTAGQIQSLEAVIHRFQRIHEGGELADGEFVDVARCSDDTCEALKNADECEHPKIMAVYRAIPLGTLVGGTFRQKVESFIRIKLANLKLKLNYR